MNKLVSIEKIRDIRPIPNADAIELCSVLGYEVVVKKGEFRDGDLCVFHHPDCLCDKENPVYSFLKDKKIRVCKLRGQTSVGLALPLSAFPSLIAVQEGDEVAEQVRAVKWEKQIPFELRGIAKGSLPPFVVKTDEPNLRSYPKALEEFKGKVKYLTKKMDGTSFSCYYDRETNQFGVCSRNLELKEDENGLLWKIARSHRLEEKLKEISSEHEKTVVIQGEVFGPGINGGHCGVNSVQFRAFDLSLGGKYCSSSSFFNLCDAKEIPKVDLFKVTDEDMGILDLIKLANSLEYGPGLPCEGFVMRTDEPVYSESLKRRLSVKMISEVFEQKFGK